VCDGDGDGGRDTHVGRDFSRFSLSSNVTRLARLWKEEWQGKGGKSETKRGKSWQVARGEGGGVGEGRGEAAWLVRWRVCSTGLPGMVRGSSICLSTAVAKSPDGGCLAAHWATESHS